MLSPSSRAAFFFLIPVIPASFSNVNLIPSPIFASSRHALSGGQSSIESHNALEFQGRPSSKARGRPFSLSVERTIFDKLLEQLRFPSNRTLRSVCRLQSPHNLLLDTPEFGIEAFLFGRSKLARDPCELFFGSSLLGSRLACGDRFNPTRKQEKFSKEIRCVLSDTGGVHVLPTA
jgi:hypothetical protein